jgi:hypothetical protein
MKNALMVLLLSIPAHHMVTAQGIKWGGRIPDDERDRTTFSVNYGAFSSDYILDGNKSATSAGTWYTYWNNQYSGTISATFQYFVSKRFSIGISAGYEDIKGTWLQHVYDGSRTGTDVPIGYFKRALFTIAPEITITYRTALNGQFRMYGAAGVGCSYSNEVDAYSQSYYNGHYINGVNTLGTAVEFNNNRLHANVQITGLGMRYGGKLCGHMEIGFGYKGIVSAGLTLKL